MLLSVTVTAADALFDLLRIPWQVVIDHRVAELKVQTFGAGVRYDEDAGVTFEVIHDGVLVFHATPVIGAAEVLCFPRLIDILCHGIIEVAVEKKNIVFRKTIPTQLRGDIFLRSLGFRENDDLL